MLAWLMKSPLIIEQIEKMSHGYLKMDCEGDKCYGVLAVRMLPHALKCSRNLETGPPHLLRPGVVPLLPRSVSHRCKGHEG